MYKSIFAAVFFMLGLSAQAYSSDRSPIDPDSVTISNLGPVEDYAPEVPQTLGRVQMGVPWWVVQDNNIHQDDANVYFADILPEDAFYYGSLEGWSAPEAVLYEFTANNRDGERVVTARFVVARMHSGSFRGQGKYLTYVTARPVSVEAQEGVRFSLAGIVQSYGNVGRPDSFIASALVRLTWMLNGPLGERLHGGRAYYVQGDGYYSDVSSAPIAEMRGRLKTVLKSAPIFD